MVVVVRIFIWTLVMFILALMIDWPMSSILFDVFIAAVGAAFYSFVRWGVQ